MSRERSVVVLALIAALLFAVAGCRRPPKPPTPKASPTTEGAISVDGDRTLEGEELDDEDEDDDDALLP
jgi:hypothetical protein